LFSNLIGIHYKSQGDKQFRKQQPRKKLH